MSSKTNKIFNIVTFSDRKVNLVHIIEGQTHKISNTFLNNCETSYLKNQKINSYEHFTKFLYLHLLYMV